MAEPCQFFTEVTPLQLGTLNNNTIIIRSQTNNVSVFSHASFMHEKLPPAIMDIPSP